MLTDVVVEVLLDDKEFIQDLQKRGFVRDRDELGYYLMRSLFVDYNEVMMPCIQRYEVKIRKAPYVSARMRLIEPDVKVCSGCGMKGECKLKH